MPTPNQGETERHFIARCVIDDEARRDFPDADQRLAFCYSQYKNKDENYLDTKTFKLSKKFGDAWKNANEKQRLITERRNTKRFTAFYNKQYNLAIKNKLELNDIRYGDLFKYNDLRKLYDEMYLDTGLHFAKWYARTFDLYIAKGVNPKQYLNQWQLAIIAYAQKNTAMNITGVANTGRKTAIKIIQRLFRDPNFVTLGPAAKARLLRKQLKGYSKYQALRVVRTETTRAANFGIQQSATSVFAGRDLIKRWSTSLDGRERDWHGRANNQERPKNDPFVVGGEYLMRPGEGSARNVINCRCSAVYLPVKDAQTINQLEGMNFGLAGSTVLDGVSVANVMRDINNAVGSTLTNPIANTLKELMRPDKWDEYSKGVVKNDNYLELLNTKPNFQRGSGAYRSGNNTIYIDSLSKAKNLEMLLAHEIGHAIHAQNGWILGRQLYFKNGVQLSNRIRYVHPIIQKLIKEQGKIFGNNLRGAAKTKLTNEWKRKYFKAFYGRTLKSDEYKIYKDYLAYQKKVRKKFPKLTDDEFNGYFLSMTDYIGGLTKGRIGQGHASSYMARGVQAEKEVFAHMMENKFVGNPVFKKLHPKLYKESIDALNKLIKLLNP